MNDEQKEENNREMPPVTKKPKVKLIEWFFFAFAVLFIILTLAGIAIYIFALTHPTIPDFYVTTHEEFLDATKNDDFIIPDLSKYDLGSFIYWIVKENYNATGKSAFYGRHRGYEINGRVIPRSSFDELRIWVYNLELRYNESNPKPELRFNVSYKGIDIKMLAGTAKIAKEGIYRYDKEWPAGSLEYWASCEFDLNNYRYDINSKALLLPDEFTDSEQILETAKSEVMELVQSIIDKAV